MPTAKIKTGGNHSKVDANKGFQNYDGPVPPKGLYRVVVKFWKIVENRNNDPMFKVLMEIAEPKASEKAKYNGYAIWHNANLTDKGAGFVNGMLDAFGINRDFVWEGPKQKIIVSQDDDEKITKIGTVKVDGLAVLVSTKKEEYPAGTGEFSLKAVSFAEAEATKRASTDDEDDERDSAPDEDDENLKASTEDEADEDGSDDEDEDGDEDSF